MRDRDLGLLIGETCTLRLGFADPWFLSNEKSDWKLSYVFVIYDGKKLKDVLLLNIGQNSTIIL